MLRGSLWYLGVRLRKNSGENSAVVKTEAMLLWQDTASVLDAWYADSKVSLMGPGMFAGELIVLMDSAHKTIKFIMKSTNPDLFICKSTFTGLVTQYFAQCIVLLVASFAFA